MQCCIGVTPCRVSQKIIDGSVRSLSISLNTTKKLTECCKILDVTESVTTDELKDAFVKLAKKYHPDSGTPTADAKRFAEIQAAYKYIRENMFKQNADDIEKELTDKDFGIKHTVPQHRRYLTSEGIGYGTPSQRQKQYDQHKMTQAVERVYNYRAKKIAGQNENVLLVKDAALAWQFKTSQAMDRLVEDLIQESMARGEFNNLPGSGKPLKYTPENPYVDSMTHKLNQILINNGFTPEWIVLDREIQTERNELWAFLKNQRSHLGKIPLTEKEHSKWNDVINQAKVKAKSLNMKIDKFNMVVPVLNKQKLHFQLHLEAEKILQKGATKFDKRFTQTCESANDQKYSENLFSFLWNIFH